MEATYTVVGITLMVIGGVLFYWLKKRKFDRTNIAGIEQFESLGGKVAAKTLDGVLFVLSLTFGMCGLMILAVAYIDSWGAIVLAPLFLWLLLGLPWGSGASKR